MIKESEKNRTLTTRELAGIYACGKTQEYQILKDKAAINSNIVIVSSLILCAKNVYRIIKRTSECNNFEYSEQKLLYSIILQGNLRIKDTFEIRTLLQGPAVSLFQRFHCISQSIVKLH